MDFSSDLPTSENKHSTYSLNPNTLWNEHQFAEYLGKTVRTVQSLRYHGTGPRFVKFGKSVRYEPKDIFQWIDANKTKSTSKGSK